MKRLGLSLVALILAAPVWGPAPARALDPINFEMTGAAHEKGAARYASEDDDEDAFFSGRRRGSIAVTGSIGSAAPRHVAPHPQVDVAATCRAVLADNPNLYNASLLDGCQRAVATHRR
jgi:hypothetical protein